MRTAMQQLPKLYPILDTGLLHARKIALRDIADALRASGVTLLQYRGKADTPQEVLQNAALISEAFAGTDCRLILNDRADLAVLGGWSGLHVGQEDLSPEDA